jgi:hypothetical protein
VRIKNLFYYGVMSALLVFGCAGFIAAQSSNQTGSMEKQQKPIMVLPDDKRPNLATTKRNLYCSGFIQFAPSPRYLEVVGAEQEQEQLVYGEADYLYINQGSAQGMKVDNLYTVVRPRGQFKSKLSKKKGFLGTYYQEIGVVRVIEVKENVSVVFVEAACDTIIFGDLLRAFEDRKAPALAAEAPLNRFEDPTGKQNGRIVLARDNKELLSKDNVVFIDLGEEDGVKAGDYMTVYRALGKGKITDFREDNVTVSSNNGYESDVFKGGPFSTSSPRVKDTANNGIYGPTTSIPDVKNRRPKMPRKIVGELVILSVQQRTATAVITRTAQEVHTGDYVEIK